MHDVFSRFTFSKATLTISVPSTDNIANSLIPDQAQQNIGPYLNPNGLTLMVLKKIIR